MLSSLLLAALTGFAPAESPLPVQLKPYPQLISTRFTSAHGLPAGPISDLRISTESVIASSRYGTAAIKLTESRWSSITGNPQPPAAGIPSLPTGHTLRSTARSARGVVFAVTDRAALKHIGGKWAPIELPRTLRPHQPMPHVDSEIRAVASDSVGHVWLATSEGLYGTDGGDWWQPLNRADGMPYEDMLAVAVAPNGDIWGGTTQGAWRLRGGKWSYFWGLRWLPGNRVSRIAADSKGGVWLATDGGVAKIEERMMTLEEKAAHYEQINAARHNRRGFVTGSNLKVAGEPEKGFTYEASDNDGLWTALYIAAESFRYAATKSPESRALAKKSMDALLDLTRLSGIKGFPARALIRKGEIVDGYDPAETVRIEGEPDKIWYTSPKDPGILAKGDTSSDELDGHYFAFYIYHDLVADSAEKKAISEVCRAITNNLLDNDYTLIGHTGRKTRWGVFGPQFINEDPRWVVERGLNSLSMLNYLKVAQHICGDKRFSDAYLDLINKHHYLLNTLNYRRDQPWWEINHSDDELAYVGYYPILMLEKDPHKRNILEQSIASTWMGIKPERSPFYNFIYGATTGRPCLAEEGVQTLQEWPWELISWPVQNSHRHDVTLKRAQGGRNRVNLERVLPMSERTTWRWNRNPYQPDGGNALNEEDAAAFLLPYWMGRYHGIITGK